MMKKKFKITLLMIFIAVIGVVGGIALSYFLYIPDIEGYWGNTGLVDSDTTEQGIYFGEDGDFKLVDKSNDICITGSYQKGKFDFWNAPLPGCMGLTLTTDERVYEVDCEVFVLHGEKYLRIYFPIEQTENEASANKYYVINGRKFDYLKLQLEEKDSNQETILQQGTNDDSDVTYDEDDTYKLYYVVSLDRLGIIGFDDGVSGSNISSAKEDLQLSGYSIECVEINGKNNIVIPENIDGYDVYAIDGGAFNNCTSITSVTIPSCVKIIEPGAFDGCRSDLIIYGDLNSAAQVFSDENNIKFINK